MGIAFSVIIFISLSISIYIILNLSPMIIAEDITKLSNDQGSIQKQALVTQGKKKRNKIVKIIKEIEFCLEVTGNASKFPMVCLLTMIMFIAGIVISLAIQNYLMMPLLALGLCAIPIYFIKQSFYSFNREIQVELETALSIITTSYIRTENLVLAVEENVKNLKHPIQEIFQRFILQTNYVNANITYAIKEMKEKVNSSIFSEWCDILLDCQKDSTLIETLVPVSEKLVDVRVINESLITKTEIPKRDFIGVVVITALFFPALYFLNKEWVEILFTTTQGKIATFVYITSVVVGFFKVVKYTQPIEYKP